MVTQFGQTVHCFITKCIPNFFLDAYFCFCSNLELVGIIICKVVTLSDSNCCSIRDKLDNIETLNLKKRNTVTIILRFHYPYVVLMLNSFGQTVMHFELRKDFSVLFYTIVKKDNL